MHFGDSIFIFLLALVLFGPKKLPEIGRTIGKLLAEFRRASNEFKFQIQEELRNMEDEERRKQTAERQAKAAAEQPAAALPAGDAATTPGVPTILPPSTGSPVSSSTPYAMPVAPAELTAPTTNEPSGIEPSAAEVVVEPAVASVAVAPEATRSEAVDLSGHVDLTGPVDLTAQGNGAHAAEPVETDLPSEPVQHG